jgi:hypothetical protein
LSFEVERIDDRFGVVECPLRPCVGGDTLSVLADLQDGQGDELDETLAEPYDGQADDDWEDVEPKGSWRGK